MMKGALSTEGSTSILGTDPYAGHPRFIPGAVQVVRLVDADRRLLRLKTEFCRLEGMLLGHS
ncbi:hypothetical protein [Insulibacter thermoxylanivorax]|uniref:hypothetical protein n=1 Tax=Insulibacter thermoxylanivorax TaxID=2749268 RepID=UPI003530E4E5